MPRLIPLPRVAAHAFGARRFASAAGDAWPPPQRVPVGPLAGTRVLELGQVIAGPYVGSILADLGCDVLKLERPDGGDDARRMGQEFRRGDALFFHHFNRGKRSLELDLTSKLDRTRLDALATQADFFVHNVKPGTDVKLGIDGPSMVARHPRLIHASISAFGAVGPLAKRPGYEPLIQAYSGLSSLNGDESDPPIRSAASLCDQGTAMWVTIGMLSLLHRRNATGKGGIVQGSLLETALMWGGQKADELVNTGKLPEKHRSGHPMMCPYEAFDASDGPILICAGNDRLFARVAEACGRPDWVTDERFATNRARLRNKPALFAELRPILASKPREHWLSVLQRLGVPASPINSLAEVLQEPQVRELGVQQAVPGEDFALTGMPFTIDGERPRIAGGAPRLGEH